MSKHASTYRSTHPSAYYERQAHQQVNLIPEPQRMSDGQWLVVVLGLGVCGYALGLLTVALMAGVL